MNKQEAAALLELQLEAFRSESWAELVRRIDLDPVVFERAGTGAATYKLEIECVWDGPRGGNVRVIGSVDDGGSRAFIPITRSFIKSADDSFVDE
jgi:hypothetical protein